MFSLKLQQTSSPPCKRSCSVCPSRHTCLVSVIKSSWRGAHASFASTLPPVCLRCPSPFPFPSCWTFCDICSQGYWLFLTNTPLSNSQFLICFLRVCYFLWLLHLECWPSLFVYETLALPRARMSYFLSPCKILTWGFSYNICGHSLWISQGSEPLEHIHRNINSIYMKE